MLNGGIIGALLDCHSNWAAAWHLLQQGKLEQPPCTVTADYAIKLLRPTRWMFPWNWWLASSMQPPIGR